ncbi:U-scoloptoxin(01)-Cw1a-like isoform X2 [Macrobrachium rosenbergii]|uniref:U-scoloptoxin(01)-Cw1a-like isoform X2 n=1 Tax=Macrobrachium rosenbergii TaxID=79674 RepID=UPI0034D4B056
MLQSVGESVNECLWDRKVPWELNTHMHRTAAALLCLATAAVALARHAWEFPALGETLLKSPLVNSFSCEGRTYGYYADMDNDCQVFHVCLPIADDSGEVVKTAHFSFLCGNQTVFSQESLTCAEPEFAFPCEESASLYDVINGEFGRVLEV